MALETCSSKLPIYEDLVAHEIFRGILLLKFENEHPCAACEYGKKQKKGHHVLIENCISEALELLYIELCDPSAIESFHYKKYIMLTIDDYTRLNLVSFLRLKSKISSV